MVTKSKLVNATLLMVLATLVALALVGCKRDPNAPTPYEAAKKQHVSDNMTQAKLLCEEKGMVLAEYRVSNNGTELARCERVAR